MAVVNETRDVVTPEPVVPVYSRISWGAIIAGAAVAMSLYILLNLFGLAIGLSVGDGTGTIGTPTAVWMIIASLIALFVGGWVTSQCTVGESRGEAVFYGVVLWGFLFAILTWMAGTGMRMGLHSIVVVEPNNQQVATYRGPAATTDHTTGNHVTAAAWWAFGGTLVSMLAAIGGTLTGASTPRVLPHHYHRTTGLRT